MLRFGVEGTYVRCRPYAWLTLEEEVKRHMRPHWERMIEIECAHEVDVRRAQLADRLSAQWLAVLTKLADNPLAAGAAKLTEDAFAEVVAGIRTEQQAAQDRFTTLMEEHLRGDLGPVERAYSVDRLVDMQAKKSD